MSTVIKVSREETAITKASNKREKARLALVQAEKDMQEGEDALWSAIWDKYPELVGGSCIYSRAKRTIAVQ